MTSTINTTEVSSPLIKVTSIQVPTTWKRICTMRPGHKRAHTIFFLEDSGSAANTANVRLEYSPDGSVFYATSNSNTTSFTHTAGTSVIYTATEATDDVWINAPFIALSAKKATNSESMTVTGFFTM